MRNALATVVTEPAFLYSIGIFGIRGKSTWVFSFYLEMFTVSYHSNFYFPSGFSDRFLSYNSRPDNYEKKKKPIDTMIKSKTPRYHSKLYEFAIIVYYFFFLQILSGA